MYCVSYTLISTIHCWSLPSTCNIYSSSQTSTNYVYYIFDIQSICDIYNLPLISTNLYFYSCNLCLMSIIEIYYPSLISTLFIGCLKFAILFTICFWYLWYFQSTSNHYTLYLISTRYIWYLHSIYLHFIFDIYTLHTYDIYTLYLIPTHYIWFLHSIFDIYALYLISTLYNLYLHSIFNIYTLYLISKLYNWSQRSIFYIYTLSLTLQFTRVFSSYLILEGCNLRFVPVIYHWYWQFAINAYDIYPMWFLPVINGFVCQQRLHK